MSRKGVKLNRIANEYFQSFLLAEMYGEVRSSLLEDPVARQAGAIHCRVKDEVERLQESLLSCLTLSRNIIPLSYPGWYVVRYQDKGGKLMLTCVPLLEETAKKLKKDGRYLPELSKEDIVKAELLKTEHARWQLAKGKCVNYVIDTLLRGAELPKLYLDLTPTFNFIEREDKEQEIKEFVADSVQKVMEARDILTDLKEKELQVAEVVNPVEEEVEPPQLELVTFLESGEPPITIDEAKEILSKEREMEAPSEIVIKEPKEEYPDLEGMPLTVSDHAVKRWLGRVRKDETTQINHRVRREVTRDVSKHFLTAVKIFGEGINDTRTSYYLDKDNVIYVFGEKAKSIITLYPINYGFSLEVDRITLLAQVEVIKNHYAKYHESKTAVTKGLEHAKDRRDSVQLEIDTKEAELAELKAKRAELETTIRRIPLESNTHLARYTKEFNKVFKKSKVGVNYSG